MRIEQEQKKKPPFTQIRFPKTVTSKRDALFLAEKTESKALSDSENSPA